MNRLIRKFQCTDWNTLYYRVIALILVYCPKLGYRELVSFARKNIETFITLDENINDSHSKRANIICIFPLLDCYCERKHAALENCIPFVPSKLIT